MGNCFQKSKNTVSEIAPSSSSSSSSSSSDKKPLVFLHGDSLNPLTHYLRFALCFKPLTLRYIDETIEEHEDGGSFTHTFDNHSVSGQLDSVLRFVDSKLPLPKLLWVLDHADDMVARMVELQHRSMRWHMKRLVTWGMEIEMASRGGKEAVDRRPRVGTPRMEVNKLGKCYGKLLEVLVEHAQMEERVLFSVLEAADPGVSRCVNEEHARDFPIMNGIKEDIKSVGVMVTGTSTYQEALCSLSARLETLQDNCSDHFNEEERNLFPLLQATEVNRDQQRKVVDQCINMMQGTHSHLFRFFIEGLVPHEAIEYLDLILTCVIKEKASFMLRLLVD